VPRDAGGLARLCRRRAGDRDHIRIAPGAPGIERLEARLHGLAYAPHRHDVYAVGITLAGVQTFGFRGTRWHCLPGQCHILHPDEPHDGSAGTDAGFAYRILYIDPRLVQAALGGGCLPFVAHPVMDATRLPWGQAACESVSGPWDFDAAIDDIACVDIVTAVADLLVAAASHRVAPPATPAFDRLLRVREALLANPASRPGMDALERLADLDRWTLARQFRAAFGTSPSRFCILRQLDLVRRLLRRGESLVEASLAAGFADQSHMSRRFKRAYGLTPGAWAAAIA